MSHTLYFRLHTAMPIITSDLSANGAECGQEVLPGLQMAAGSMSKTRMSSISASESWLWKIREIISMAPAQAEKDILIYSAKAIISLRFRITASKNKDSSIRRFTDSQRNLIFLLWQPTTYITHMPMTRMHTIDAGTISNVTSVMITLMENMTANTPTTVTTARSNSEMP